jgi:hypothetical protein
MVGRQHAWVLVRDWLGKQRPVDRDRALAELARRYLAGHSPAGERDLAKWAGLPLRHVRGGLAAIAGELEVLDGGLVRPAGGARAAELPRPRLLGSFEPVLMGWTSREPILRGAEGAVVGGGLFRPFALVRGRAAATWRLEQGRIVLSSFGRVQTADARALEEDGEEVLRFLGGAELRFPD